MFIYAIFFVMMQYATALTSHSMTPPKKIFINKKLIQNYVQHWMHAAADDDDDARSTIFSCWDIIYIEST